MVEEGAFSLRDVLTAGLALLLAVVAWFSRRDVKRWDDAVERLAELERTAVTHEQLDRATNKIEQHIEMRHAENISRFDKLDDTLTPHLEKASDWRHAQATAINTANNKLTLLVFELKNLVKRQTEMQRHLSEAAKDADESEG